MRKTIYKQRCYIEDVKETNRQYNKLSRRKIKLLSDYYGYCFRVLGRDDWYNNYDTVVSDELMRKPISVIKKMLNNL